MPTGKKHKSAGQEQDAPPAKAFRCKPAIVLFLVITIGGLTADLWSKHHVFNSLLNEAGLEERVAPLAQSVRDPDKLLPYLNLHKYVLNKVKFTLSTNPGIVFGLHLPPIIVAIVSVITIGMVVFFFATSPARAFLMHIALAFILGGAMGNLYDRLFSTVYIPGVEIPIANQVRDFVDFSDYHMPFSIFGYNNYPWIFNIADVLLVAGVGLLMISGFGRSRKN